MKRPTTIKFCPVCGNTQTKEIDRGLLHETRACKRCGKFMIKDSIFGVGALIKSKECTNVIALYDELLPIKIMYAYCKAKRRKRR
jgi:RNA polymerase subunit RPABC4/transcription elongation factor Spt4